jgi:hypothetical protein
MNAFSSDDWRERKVREWLLLMLRFAVTREARDRLAVLAIAMSSTLLAATGGQWPLGFL